MYTYKIWHYEKEPVYNVTLFSESRCRIIDILPLVIEYSESICLWYQQVTEIGHIL